RPRRSFPGHVRCVIVEVRFMTRRKPDSPLTFRPLTPRLMDDLGTVLRGGWGAGCWCLHPRLSAAESRALPGPGNEVARRRAEMTRLARRRRAPGLPGFDGKAPAGGAAAAPRAGPGRIRRARRPPRADDGA